MNALRSRALRAAFVAVAYAALLGAPQLVAVPQAFAQPGSVTWNGPSQCGTAATYTAPAGAAYMDVLLKGGGGGTGGAVASSQGYGGAAGSGGVVEALFPVRGGQRITAVVGCQGGSGPEGPGVVAGGPGRGGAGWAPGGSGGSGYVCTQPGANCTDSPTDGGAGGGGGATALCLGTTCPAASSQGAGTNLQVWPNADPKALPLLAVAGGGGGGGEAMCAGSAGGAGGTGGAGSVAADLAGDGSGPGGANGGNGQTNGDVGGSGASNDSSAIAGDGSTNVGGTGQSGAVAGEPLSDSAGMGGGGGGMVGGAGSSYPTTGTLVFHPTLDCGEGGGGGGGSSWVSNTAAWSAFAVQSTAAAGSVVVTFGLASPPTATIASPAGGTYSEGQLVPTSFGCAEGAGGSGLASCKDSNGATDGSGQLNTTHAGTFAYTVTATSEDGQTDTTSIGYTVTATSTTTLTASPSQPVAGGSVTLTASVGCPSATPAGIVTFSYDLGGSAFNEPTSLTNGTTSVIVANLPAGALDVTAAYGGQGTCAASSGTLDLNVITGTAPAITSAADAAFTIGQFGTFTVTTTGTPAPALTLTSAIPGQAASAALPLGVTFVDNGDGTATLSGTPAAATGGTYPLTINASNGVTPAASLSFDLTVTAPVVASQTGFSTNGTASAAAGGVTATGTGPGDITVAQYGGDPGGPESGVFQPSGAYFDIATSSGSSFSTLTATDCNLDGGDVAYWWSGRAWEFVQPFNYNPASGCAAMTFSTTSVPPLAQLTGSPFAVAVLALPSQFTSSDTATLSLGQPGNIDITTTGLPTPTVSTTSTPPPGLALANVAGGTAVVTGTPTATGTYTMSLTASNGVAPAASQTLTIRVIQPILFTSASEVGFTLDQPASFTISAAGSPAPVLSTNSLIPKGLVLYPNGSTATLKGTPTVAGTYTLDLTAANGVSPDATQALAVIVGTPPAITSGGAATFATGLAGSFTVTTTGSPAPAITESGNLPPGVTFTDNGDGTAALSGAATAAGSYPLTITADNGVGSAASESLTLTVGAPVTASQTATSTSASGTVTASVYGVTANASGAGSVTVAVYGADPGGPPPFTASGAYFDVSVSTGNDFGTVSVTDSSLAGGDAAYWWTGTVWQAVYPETYDAGSGVLNITLNATSSPTLAQLTGTPFAVADVYRAPQFTSAGAATFTVGQPGSFTVTTTGAPTPAISESGALPAGVSFTDNHDGTATLAGTPQPGTGKAYTLTLAAANGAAAGGTGSQPTGAPATVTQTFTLTVDQAPSISGPGSATFTVGVDSTVTVTAAAYPVPTLTENGALPAGVSFIDHGGGTATLAGAPDPGTVGRYPLTIAAQNGISPEAVLDLTLTVSAAPTTTTVGADAPSSVVGQPVTYTATVTPAPDGGTVAFADGASTITGCAAQPLASAVGKKQKLFAGAQATCEVTYSAPGSHLITATYSGDASFDGSASGALTETVAQAATSLTLSSQAEAYCPRDRRPGVCAPATGPQGPAAPGQGASCDHERSAAACPHPAGPRPPFAPGRPAGACDGFPGLPGGPRTVSGSVYLGPDTSILCQPVTFTATVVVVAPGAGTPTGSVTFTDGTTTLGTVSLTATGTAALTTDQLPAGSQTIRATYGGDTDFLGSDAALTQHVRYRFVGLLPPLDHNQSVDPKQTVPVMFMLLDAQGRPVHGATATLQVNGGAPAPFREVGAMYQYDLRLGDQGVTSGTAALTITVSDGTTHTFTLTLRSPAPSGRR